MSVSAELIDRSIHSLVTVAVASLLVGCGGAAGVDDMRLALDATSGLRASQVGSVVVLVLGRADCARALAPHSPLDDPSLVVVAHALFTVDGNPKRLGGLPAGEPLTFYVDAFDSPDGRRPRVGRGCAEATLSSAQASGLSIMLTAAPDD